MNSIRIGLALITEDSFLNRIVEIEKKIAQKYNFLTDLGTTYNLPHTTLFQGRFEEGFNYCKILKQIEQKLKELHLKELKFIKVEYVPEGWYFYLCKKTDKLMKLHTYVLDLVKDDVILDLGRFKRDLSKLTKDQLEALKNYGYRYSGNAFDPHITLARTSEGKNNEIVEAFQKDLNLITKTPKLERLTVYLIGPNGSHKETLDEIYLNNG